MGNLYTRIVRKGDGRIDILSQLKQEWNNRPINFKKIRELQKRLDKLNSQNKQPEKIIGALDRGYLSKIATRGKT